MNRRTARIALEALALFLLAALVTLGASFGLVSFTTESLRVGRVRAVDTSRPSPHASTTTTTKLPAPNVHSETPGHDDHDHDADD